MRGPEEGLGIAGVEAPLGERRRQRSEGPTGSSTIRRPITLSARCFIPRSRPSSPAWVRTCRPYLGGCSSRTGRRSPAPPRRPCSDLGGGANVADRAGSLPGRHEGPLRIAAFASADEIHHALLVGIGDLVRKALDLRGLALHLRDIRIPNGASRLARVAASARGGVVRGTHDRFLVRGRGGGFERSDEAGADDDTLRSESERGHESARARRSRRCVRWPPFPGPRPRRRRPPRLAERDSPCRSSPRPSWPARASRR